MKSAALRVKLNWHDSLSDSSNSWSPLVIQVIATLLLNIKMEQLPSCMYNDADECLNSHWKSIPAHPYLQKLKDNPRLWIL